MEFAGLDVVALDGIVVEGVGSRRGRLAEFVTLAGWKGQHENQEEAAHPGNTEGIGKKVQV